MERLRGYHFFVLLGMGCLWFSLEARGYSVLLRPLSGNQGAMWLYTALERSLGARKYLKTIGSTKERHDTRPRRVEMTENVCQQFAQIFEKYTLPRHYLPTSAKEH